METAAATGTTLPNDVVREILLRVAIADTAALFRCATACKQWRALVADPIFLRRRWPEDAGLNTSTLVGFIALQIDHVKPVFVPGSPPVYSRLLSSFCGAAGFLDNAVPLTSRRGLLLVRIHQRVCGEANQLAVCDVLAGKCDMLPPLKHNADFDITCYTILTTADCGSKRQQRPLAPGYSSFFKVLIVGVNNHGTRNQYYLLTFSSDESSWTAPRECPIHDDMTHEYKRGSAVVCRGTAHWLFWRRSGYHTLDMSIDTGHVSLTKILFRPGRFTANAPQLSIAIDGTLSLLDLHKAEINIWTRQEIESAEGTAEWICTRIVELKRPEYSLNGKFSICVGERSCRLLFLHPHDAFALIVNLETGTTEDVFEQFKGLLCEPILPLKLNWPSFFMSRLGYSGKDAYDIKLPASS